MRMLSLGGAVLLAGVDAFGNSQDAGPVVLLTYWVGVMSCGGLITALASDILDTILQDRARPLPKGLGLILAVTLIMTPLCWLASGLLLHGSWTLSRMVQTGPQVLLVAGALITLQHFVDAREPARSTQSSQPAGEPLLHRLPQSMRDAELHAVSVEDHYLRFHTSAGSGLVLMSLERALPHLDALGGSRTHRSWWVARDAVLGATRGRGRAALELKNGIRAPVSRSYAPQLRREGWY